MKSRLFMLVVVAAMSSALVAHSQSPITKQFKRKAPGIPNVSKQRVKILDLLSVVKSRSSLVTKAAYYANMPDHGARAPGSPAAHPAVQARTINGVTYRLQTTPFPEEPELNPGPAGSPRTETSSDHRRVCTAVPSHGALLTLRAYLDQSCPA